ncbi:MAG: hypothetical protein PHS17_06890 [Desulfobacterales bacterium]|nr:hypothetical protein [Desulfobacterales bacterium]
MRPCNKSIQKTIRMTEAMLALADQGEAAREDNGCGVLYSVLRDSAYKIKRLAEEEKQAHIRKGWWNSSEEKGEDYE